MHSERCPLLDYESFDDYKNIDADNMLKMVKKRIDNDFYIYSELNEKYIKRTKANAENFDFTHTQLIYGYSDNKQEVYAMIFDLNRKYSETVISYANFISGFNTSNPLLPYRFFRINNNYFTYNWLDIICHFVYYLENHIAQVNDDTVCYGTLALRHLQEYLLNMKYNNKRDSRLMGILKDHKTVILDKMLFLKNAGVNISDEIIKEYAKVKEEAHVCESLYLKFEITNDADLIDNICNRIDYIIKAEESSFLEIAQMTADYAKENQLIDL
jgi:hypothetical protein